MARFLLPLAQVFTASGRLGAGYRLRFFEAGTSTPLDTYHDAARTVVNPNPMIADAAGRFDDIFMGDQPYKVTLHDGSDVEVWSADPVQSATGELGVPIPVAKGGTGAVDVAGVFASFGLGDAATYDVGPGADQVPTNAMVSGVPTGAIIMWSGAIGGLPVGWALCDGGTYSKSDGSGVVSTPDLRDRFVVGAGTTYGVNATGGAASATTSASGGGGTVTTSPAGGHAHGGATQGHTLTVDQIPAHNHPASMAANYNINSVVSQNFAGSENPTAGNNTTAVKNTGGGQSHSHGITAEGDHTHTVTTTDHSHTVATIPPFLALAYIFKL